MDWIIFLEVIYLVILALVCLRIIYDTRNVTKTLAYLLLAIFVPILGMLFYFSFGINYRKRKIYSKKLIEDKNLGRKFREELIKYTRLSFENSGPALKGNLELAKLLLTDSRSAPVPGNKVKLLVNGEEKFPEVLRVLREAKNHIHIEYYMYEDDEIGRAIEKVLIQKAAEGITVRFIYDDFGSRSIRPKLARRLKEAGVQIFPFNSILFLQLANRLNYRNHRKIIVVDGCSAFVGGINVSDKYINKNGDTKSLYWRDTHLLIEGPGVYYLQYLFMCDWNFCAKEHLHPNRDFYPALDHGAIAGDKVVQIAASGPDSDTPTILFAILQAINLATKEIMITTPYFIPGESVIDALMVASMSGVKVKLLLPGKSDSKIVDAASRSSFDDLLNAGIEIYLYQKGFIHAKTLVADRQLAMVGTANMDYRSFDLNFEVNAFVYSEEFAEELAAVFEKDLKNTIKLERNTWLKRPVYRQMLEKTARLVSPLL